MPFEPIPALVVEVIGDLELRGKGLELEEWPATELLEIGDQDPPVPPGSWQYQDLDEVPLEEDFDEEGTEKEEDRILPPPLPPEPLGIEDFDPTNEEEVENGLFGLKNPEEEDSFGE